MLSKSHPLIEATVRPLSDNAEQKLAAIAMLEKTFNPADSAVAISIARLEKSDRKRFPQLWRTCLYISATVAFLLLVFPLIRKGEIRHNLATLGVISDHGSAQLELPDHLTPQQELLLGDSNLPELRQKELLHLSEPERADFYTEYIGAYISEHDILPAGYLETIARIDPRNSFHLYNAATVIGGDSIEKVKPASSLPPSYTGRKKIRKPPEETVWKVKDEKEFDNALELFAAAASLPDYDSYEVRLAASRLQLFNQDRMSPRINTLAYFYGHTNQIIRMRKLTELISARAYFLSHQGNKDAFLKLYADNETFLDHLSRAPESSLVCELIYVVNAAGTATSFHFGADRLDLHELAEKMQIRRKAFIDDANFRDSREYPVEYQLEEEGSILAVMTAQSLSKQVTNPPHFDPTILTPGRLAEYDVYSSALIPVVVGILGLVALGGSISSLLLPRPVRVITKRLELLLRPVDWVWLAGAIILPIAFTIIISRYTALGGNNFSIQHNQMLFPAIHYIPLILLLITVPYLLISWRLTKRLSAFGVKNHFRIVFIILPTLGTISFVIAHPVIEFFSINSDGLGMLPLILFPGMWGASIVIAFASISFGKKEHRIARATALRTLPVALSIAIIPLAMLVPIFNESAEEWMNRDQITRVVPNGVISYEAKIVAQKRKETNAILGR